MIVILLHNFSSKSSKASVNSESEARASKNRTVAFLKALRIMIFFVTVKSNFIWIIAKLKEILKTKKIYY